MNAEAMLYLEVGAINAPTHTWEAISVAVVQHTSRQLSPEYNWQI